MAKRVVISLALITTILLAFSGILVGLKSARAASYCQVNYTVTNQWPGGF